jgi:uncharacterized repeat protein (TIGR01451 family)
VRRRSITNRWLALATGLATVLALTGAAIPALAGNTRTVTVGSAGDGLLPSVTVSAGESIIFPLTVRNTGKQTLNNVMLSVGEDGLPLVVEKNPQTAAVPQQPIDLPPGVTISDNDTGGGLCSGGARLSCTVGTLAARTSFDITVTITSTRDAAAEVIPTKAVVTVAEIGNDQGSNMDTFAAEGSLSLLAFSCDSISAYRTHGQPKLVSTCAVTDPDNLNGQSASVLLPAHLSTIGLNDAVTEACPAQLATCYSNAAVVANIEGDETGDTIKWILDVRLPAGTNVNVYKVVVYHEADGVPANLIELTKKNGCKSDTQKNCGVAELIEADGVLILRVTIQTGGNGKVHW